MIIWKLTLSVRNDIKKPIQANIKHLKHHILFNFSKVIYYFEEHFEQKFMYMLSGFMSFTNIKENKIIKVNWKKLFLA